MLRSLPFLLVSTLPAMAFAQCDDTCSTANNGVCDSTCAIGTDCTDCAAEDRVRDILLIVFGVGSGLGVLGLCYLTIQRFRRSKPAPDVEEAVSRKSAPNETKADVPNSEKGGDAKKVKPSSRNILGVEVQAVAAEKTVTTGGADKKTVGMATSTAALATASTGTQSTDPKKTKVKK